MVRLARRAEARRVFVVMALVGRCRPLWGGRLMHGYLPCPECRGSCEIKRHSSNCRQRPMARHSVLIDKRPPGYVLRRSRSPISPMRTCGSAIESADVVARRRTVADLLLAVEPLHVRRQVSEHNGRSFRTSDRLSSLSGSVAATESPAHHVTDLTPAPHPARPATPMASNDQRSPRTSPVPSALRCRLTSAQSSSLSSLRSTTIQPS